MTFGEIKEIAILVFGGSIIGYIGSLIIMIWAGAIWVVFGQKRVSVVSSKPEVRISAWQGFLQILRWLPLLALLHPFPFVAACIFYGLYHWFIGSMPPKADWVFLGILLGLGKLVYEARQARLL